MSSLQSGKILTILDETLSGTGQIVREFTTDSDTIQTSLFVSSITGSLSVNIYTMTSGQREKEIITYQGITTPSTELDVKKAATVMGSVRVKITYTGTCSLELRAKGLSSGETSAKIQSANTAKASQITVYTSPVILLAAAISDRKGVIVKNNSNNGILYLGFAQAQASPSVGYPLGKGEALSLDVGAGANLWGIASSGLIDVRIIEAGG